VVLCTFSFENFFVETKGIKLQFSDIWKTLLII